MDNRELVFFADEHPENLLTLREIWARNHEVDPLAEARENLRAIRSGIFFGWFLWGLMLGSLIMAFATFNKQWIHIFFVPSVGWLILALFGRHMGINIHSHEISSVFGRQLGDFLEWSDLMAGTLPDEEDELREIARRVLMNATKAVVHLNERIFSAHISWDIYEAVKELRRLTRLQDYKFEVLESLGLVDETDAQLCRQEAEREFIGRITNRASRS